MLRAIVLFALFTVVATTSHAQWQLQDAHTTADLRGIDNVGGGVAWASGTDGTILRTEDAGFVWQLCAKPPAGEHLDFRAIQASDNNTAIIMSSGKGDLSRLYKTTDGCQSWHLLFTNPDKDGFWDGMARIAASKHSTEQLWILGDPVNGRFRIFRNTDDAVTHFDAEETPSLAVHSQKSGAFAASNSALFILPKGPQVPVGPPLPPPPPGSHRTSHYEVGTFPLLCFVTGGEGGAQFYVRQPPQMYDISLKPEWKSFPLPLGDGSDSSGAFSIALIEPRLGVIVGGDYNNPTSSMGTAAFVTPKTPHWLPPTTSPHGYRSAVAYDSKSKTWITVGPNGTDISTDDGRNWHALKPDPKFNDTRDADQHWNALSLPYAVGPHGRIGTLRPSALEPAK